MVIHFNLIDVIKYRYKVKYFEIYIVHCQGVVQIEAEMLELLVEYIFMTTFYAEIVLYLKTSVMEVLRKFFPLKYLHRRSYQI